MLPPLAQIPALTLLGRAVAADRVLEVGTFTGYTALLWGRLVGPAGAVVTVDTEAAGVERLGRAAWAAAGVADRITAVTGDGVGEWSRRAGPGGEAGTWDVAFVDGDKARVGVYYELGVTLVRAGGLVIVDDVCWSGRTEGADARAMRDVRARAAADARVVCMTVEAGDGMLVALKL